MTQADLYMLLPMIILVVWATLLLVADLWIPKNHKGYTALLAAAGLAISLGFTLSQANLVTTGMNGMVVVDGSMAGVGTSRISMARMPVRTIAFMGTPFAPGIQNPEFGIRNPEVVL